MRPVFGRLEFAAQCPGRQLGVPAIKVFVSGPARDPLRAAKAAPDSLMARAKPAPVLPFSVSGEHSSGSSTLQAEMAVMLKRAGAAQIITYAAADIAEKLTTDPDRTGISL